MYWETCDRLYLVEGCTGNYDLENRLVNDSVKLDHEWNIHILTKRERAEIRQRFGWLGKLVVELGKLIDHFVSVLIHMRNAGVEVKRVWIGQQVHCCLGESKGKWSHVPLSSQRRNEIIRWRKDVVQWQAFDVFHLYQYLIQEAITIGVGLNLKQVVKWSQLKRVDQ